MSAETIPYYVEINLLTLMILVIIQYNVSRGAAYFSRDRFYKYAIFSTMIAIISDAAATFLEGAMYPGSIIVNYILDDIYFISSLAIPYLFWAYVRSLIYPNRTLKSAVVQVVAIPLYVYIILVLTSFKTGLVFTINSLNQYSRGPLRSLHAVIAAFILILTFFYTLYHYLKNDLPEGVGKPLVFVPIFPLLGVILRNLLQGSNIIWTAMTLGLLLIYLSGQNTMIYIDPLTKLNNRGRSNDYLKIKMQGLSDDTKLVYTILDLNHFKEINDKMGHTEGDRALKIFAKMLQDTCANRKDFIARWGGDEFVIISERPLDGNVDDVINDLDRRLKDFNHDDSIPYRITCSLGSAETSKAEFRTEEELLTLADERMYKDKLKYHREMQSALK